MRTYVINFRKITESLVMAVAAAIAITFIISPMVTGIVGKKLVAYTSDFSNMEEAFPLIGGLRKKSEKKSGIKIIKLFINEDTDNPEKIIAGAIPAVSGIKEKITEIYSDIYESNSIYNENMFKGKKSEPGEVEIPGNIYRALETHGNSIIKNGNYLEQKGITVKNQTNYPLDIESLYKEPLGIKYLNGDIQVLILHTHGSESYNPDDRNQDLSKNVVRVGDEITKIFEQNGIGVIHSKVMHDIPRYNSSYRKSLETITNELRNNNKINIVLDVHRDAMIAENGDSYKTVCNLDGKTAAQVMFVVGTNQGGLQHDNWKENLKLAMKFQEAVNKRCPNLARPIYLRTERFNQQMTTGSLIIEVGTNGNTLDEAVRAGAAAADAMAEVIKSLK